MAHNFKIVSRPHKNKDGTESKSKRDYVVVDRSRHGSVEVGVASTYKAAEGLLSVSRMMLHSNHIKKHPNDKKFQQKHGYNGIADWEKQNV